MHGNGACRHAAAARALPALLLAGALALPACPSPALAADVNTDEDTLELELSVPETIELARTGVLELPASCTPESIEVGIDCGMVEMCGIDPCLCGAVDAYGACACNGTRQVDVSYEVTFADGGVATLVEWRGVQYLVPLGSGDVQATVTASLQHYEDATATVTVHVTGWTALDVAKVAGLLLAALLALAACVGVVLGIVRAVRAALRAVRRRWKARGTRTAGTAADDCSVGADEGTDPSGEDGP